VWLFTTINQYGKNNLCSEGLRNIVLQREKLVWKERPSSLEDEKSSEYEDHVSVNLESDGELEGEDEIDPQPVQDQPVSNQIISSLKEEKYRCKKKVKLNGLLAEGMSHPAWLPK
jgi:hypothetical protein